MYDSTIFLTTEIDYRSDRIRAGVAMKGKRSHTRVPRLRRTGHGNTTR